jgi:hypothetical protein
VISIKKFATHFDATFFQQLKINSQQLKIPSVMEPQCVYRAMLIDIASGPRGATVVSKQMNIQEAVQSWTCCASSKRNLRALLFAEHTRTAYLGTLEEFLLPLSHEMLLNRDMFPDKWVARDEPVTWTLHSPDSPQRFILGVRQCYLAGTCWEAKSCSYPRLA